MSVIRIRFYKRLKRDINEKRENKKERKSGEICMETSKLINGDCLETLKELPDHTVDLLCTDPPYG